mgnify:CR=1 FL=1
MRVEVLIGNKKSDVVVLTNEGGLDPVTGSAHCALAPYWGKKLGKTTLNAKQLSRRGGEIECELKADRVALKGYAAKYMSGEIEI